jgi:hypothetical protein
MFLSPSGTTYDNDSLLLLLYPYHCRCGKLMVPFLLGNDILP